MNELAVLDMPISSYCVDLSAMCPTLINGWSPFTIRYAGNEHEWNGQEKAKTIQDELKQLAKTVIQMQIDGVW